MNSFKVNDEVTIGTSGQVIYGIVKVNGDQALVIKVGLTRQRTARTPRWVATSELVPA